MSIDAGISKSPPAEQTPSIGDRLRAAVVTPVQAFRWAYLPPMMVYFSYGVLGLIAIAQQFWVKNALTMLSTADLAAIGIWLTLPWSIKMVFGELVDSVPIFGSRRRVYVFIGAGLLTASMLLLAGAASGALTFASPDKLYVAASILSVLGVVIQDVAADAMSTEVVDRVNPDGTPRSKDEVDYDLAMVQVLGRLAMSAGMFLVAGLGGILAAVFSPATVFMIGLVVPAISIIGALLVKTDSSEGRPVDWPVLGGGIGFGAFVTALGLSGVPFAQEIIFLASVGVIGWMIARITRDMSGDMKSVIVFASVFIFMYRVTPLIGEGYFWYSVDRLGFDEAFNGWLDQISTAVALVVAWIVADAITRMRMTSVLLWLTVLGTVLSLPTMFLVMGGHLWTEQVFGFGARSIAIVNAAATSPLDTVGMIPLLALVARYAPKNNRALWFALTTSFMNLALVGAGLLTKYLNQIFVVTRTDFSQLPALTAVVILLGFLIPYVTLVLLRDKID
jgi:MFS family permease